jgi:copper resistance protein C
MPAIWPLWLACVRGFDLTNNWRTIVKRFLATTAAFLFCFSAAQAHTHLASSTPAEGAVLASAPKEIMLHFSEATRLTAVTIQKEGDKAQKTISALPKAATDHVTLPVEQLAPGKYNVEWRAVGADNHVMKGQLHFTVEGK